MKTIQQIRTFALGLAPWVIGVTIVLGFAMVFSNMAYNYANSKSIAIEIGFAVTMLLGLIGVPWHNFKNIFKSKIVWAVGGFLVVVLIATFTSIDPTISWLSHMERGVGTFFLLSVSFGSFFAILIAYHTGTLRKAILYPIALGGAIVGFSTMIGYTGFNLTKILVIGEVSRGGGVTGNSSFAGTVLIVSFFIMAYLFFTTQSSWKKIILAIFGFVTVFNPVIFNYQIVHEGIHGPMSFVGDARGAAVSLILGVLVMIGIYASFSIKKNIKWFGRILAGGVIIATCVSVVFLVIPHNAVHNAFSKDTEGTRFLYWNIALQSAKEHPLLGTGPETYRYADEKFFNPDILRPTFGGEIWADKPHNIYLEILATTGILGCLAYLMMIASLKWALFQSSRKQKTQGKKETQMMIAAVAGLLFAYLLNNLILFDLATGMMVFYLVVFWLAHEELAVRGIAVGDRDSGHGQGSSQNSAMYSDITTFTTQSVLGILIIIGVLMVVVPEIHKMKVVLKEMYAPVNIRPELYHESESISSFGSGLSFAERADVYGQNYQSHINEIVGKDAKTQALVLADIDALTAELTLSLSKYPVTTQGLVALGRLAGEKIAVENKLDPEALNQMGNAGSEIIKISPTNLQGYWFLGQAFIYQGKYQEALKYFNQALAIDPQVAESHLAIINLAKLMGDQKLIDQANAAYAKDVLPADRK